MPRKSLSSSSDDEDDLRLQQLREATVTFDTIKDNNKKDIKIKNEQLSSKKSKRYKESDEEDPNNACDVTPEFQEFVAKKLKSKLEESIELVTQLSKKKKVHKTCSEESFNFEIVKNVFLKNSEKLKSQNEDKKSNKKHKKHKKKKSKNKNSDTDSDSDSNCDLNMLKEAAIDVEFLAKTTKIEKHKNEFLNLKK